MKAAADTHGALRSRPIGNRFMYSGFLRSWRTSPGRPALDVAGEVYSFQDLGEHAAALAATIQRRTPEGGSPLTAVFAHRSSTAFAGILGALIAGNGYVPLNRKLPAARTRSMLMSSNCRSLVVDAQSEPQLEEVLSDLSGPLLILLPDRVDVGAVRARWADHIVLGAAELESHAAWTEPVETSEALESVAYLLFTSGSTGTPKGVMVSHRNVAHFVDVMVDRYGITADDRFSQQFDTTFDLSVLDLFVAWERGACVCCLPDSLLMNPDAFIRGKALTVWTSVPSVGVFMKRLGVLKPGRFPSLRWSFFCGEPLPADVAHAWANAAPGSTVENLYGPTELTVACTSYRWDASRSPEQSAQGIVPIGNPFPAMDAIVVDEDLREVPPGGVGELLMSGPQVTSGYWQNPEETAGSYVSLHGRPGVFYKTGDRVRRPAAEGSLTYVGRVDHQIKIVGVRVELGEVEAALREQPGIAEAVAVGWPLSSTGADGVVAFVTGAGIDTAAVLDRLAATLHRCAVPKAIHVVPELPRNPNGKIDRRALLQRLES
jgi:amino acid adenylation domain-containing protein